MWHVTLDLVCLNRRIKMCKEFDAISYCYPHLSVLHTTSTVETSIYLSISHYHAKLSIIMFETASEDLSEEGGLCPGAVKSLVQFFCYSSSVTSDVLPLCSKSSSKPKWLLKMWHMLLKPDSSVSFWSHPLKLWLSIRSPSSKIPVTHLIRRNSLNRKPLRSST